MSSATQYNPSREDFASMLDESFNNAEALEGSVVKGRVIAIEKDMAVIDLGLKTEAVSYTHLTLPTIYSV